MKRIKIYTLLLVSSLMASCTALDLSPEDIYSINNYWNSEAQCDRFVDGLHFRMRSRDLTYFKMGELRGGLFNQSLVNSTGEGAHDIPIKTNALSVISTGLSNWGSFYMDIYQINHAIDKISTACPFLSDNTRNLYLGQLYGMRAFYYFHLLRTWGGVPLCDKPDVLNTGDIAQLRKPRATEQETWQFIRNDVDRSCEHFSSLAFTKVKEDNCYWGKAASYCLKADVYLWGAKVKPLKGSAVFSPTPEQDMADAKTALLAVESLYKPNATFIAAFSPTVKTGNVETIFAFRNQLGESSTIFSDFTYNHTGFTSFLDAQGNALNNPLGIGSSAQRYEYAIEFFNTIDDKDTRKLATFLPYYQKDTDGNLNLMGTVVRKFLGNKQNNNVQFDNDMPIYRYMDVALMLAEVCNELNDGAGVKTWIEKCRERAYGKANMPAFTYTNKDAAEEAILAERKVEFIGEYKAWYDMRRMLGGKYALELVDGNELKLVWPIDATTLSNDNLVKQNEAYL